MAVDRILALGGGTSPLVHTILNFHGVGPVTRSVDAGERNCWLDQDAFEAVLDLVRGQPQVRLTFDDGNASDFTHALPALKQRGLLATFFVCSGRLGQPTFVTPAEVRELQAQGMTIGSHGVDHVPWRGLPAEKLRSELAESRRVLGELCGRPVEAAACPFGSYDRRVLAGLRAAGYRAVYTSDGGRAAANSWVRARTTITRSMALNTIQDLVRRGIGPWRQAMISARKAIKQLR